MADRNPIRAILAPVDFSAGSQEAVRYACELAQRVGASITLLHVYQPPRYLFPEGPGVYVSLYPTFEEELRTSLEAALQAAKAEVEARGISAVNTRLLTGYPASEIIRVAGEGGYDLIVMGTHGRTGVRHVLLGSVAEQVVRGAPCPVLTVRSSVLSPHGRELEAPPAKEAQPPV